MASTIELTEIRNIRILNQGKLRAFVDLVFNGALVIKGFKVINGSKGLFVASPARQVKGKDGEADQWNDIVYFVKDSGVWQKFQEKILAHYNEHAANGSSSSGGGDDI